MDYKNKYLKYKLKYLKKKGGMDLWNFVKKYEDKDIYDNYDSDIFYENLYNEMITEINSNKLDDIKPFNEYVFLISDFIYTLLEKKRNIDDEYIKKRNINNKLQYKIDYNVLFNNIVDFEYDYIMNENDEYIFYRNIIIENADKTTTLYIIFPFGPTLILNELEFLYKKFIEPNLINIISTQNFDTIVIGGFSIGGAISYYVLPYLIDILYKYKPSFDSNKIFLICLGLARMNVDVIKKIEEYYLSYNFNIIDIMNLQFSDDNKIFIDNYFISPSIYSNECNHNGHAPGSFNTMPYYCFDNSTYIDNSYENLNNAEQFYFCSNSNHYNDDNDIKYCLNDLNKYHSHNRINNLLLDNKGNFYIYNKEEFFLKYSILFDNFNKKIYKSYLKTSHIQHSLKTYINNLIKYKY